MIAFRTPIFAAFSAVVLLAAPAHALELDASALTKLAAGETITKFTPDPSESAAGLLEAVVDIQAMPAAVWAVLTDCAAAVKVFSGLKACKIISSEPGGKVDVREHTISWSRLLPTVRSVFRSQYDEPKQIRFIRTEGDLKQLKGEWRLETLPDGTTTRLHYAAIIAVGIPVPSALVRAAMENDMPKSMKAVRAAAMAK